MAPDLFFALKTRILQIGLIFNSHGVNFLGMLILTDGKPRY